MHYTRPESLKLGMPFCLLFVLRIGSFYRYMDEEDLNIGHHYDCIHFVTPHKGWTIALSLLLVMIAVTFVFLHGRQYIYRGRI